MKKILYILMALPLLLCCVREEIERPGGYGSEEPEADGKVLVRLSVTLPDGNKTPGTKALSDTPAGDLENLYVAVFGRSGYLKEYVQATMVQNPTQNGHIGQNDNRYDFYVSLTLSENSERHIHILGNGPEIMEYARETEILDTLLSTHMKGGYWQTFNVPGIKGKRDADGNLIGEDTMILDGEVVHLGTGTFQISDETAAFFQDIPLVRNFAKIVVEDKPDCNFTTYSFAAINTATQGSMAPYYYGGFVTDYQNYSYTDLVDLGYPAKLPPATMFNNRVPSASAFTHPNDSSSVAAAGSSYFMYERPVPNEHQPATVVILYGHFTDPDTDDGVDDSGDFYYKVDLMENGEYYPIYRNFKYRISIEKILRPGAESPSDALLSMGSGDVSADISTQNIKDISDGTSRILVSYMSKTLIRQYPYEDNGQHVTMSLLYKFIPDVAVDANNDGEPDCNNNLVADGGPITISLQNVSGTQLITGYEVASADVDGWREITISTIAPAANIISQYIRVSGQVNGNNPIYRNVTYTMMNTQTMTVTCVPSKVQSVAGEDLEVDISIPKNLPASMFPIIFNLEASALSLTPDNSKPNNNLPVTSGPSIISGKNETTFHFVRTLSESEYQQLASQSSNNSVTVPCYFTTNVALSASSVYVTDQEGYFVGDNDAFTNYRQKSFTNLAFPSGIPATSGAATPFTFQMDSSDPLPAKVYFQFTGLRPTGTSGLSLITDSSDPYYGWYWYSPGETGNATLNGNYNPTVNLATTTANGSGRVIINADEYIPATLSVGYATGISLNKTSTSIGVGSTETLIATVTPADAANKNVTWSTSDASIATVSGDGTVTGVARGTAVITATAVDGGFTASCTVTVRRKVWHAASYTLSFTSNTDGSATSFTDSPENVTFENFDRGGSNNNRYKQMGSRSGGGWFSDYTYSSGICTVTAPTGYSESRIIGITNTYNGGYDDRAVTYTGDGNTLSGTAASWGTTSTGSTTEVSGYNTVVISHSCTSSTEYSNRNRLTGMTVYYGYFTYE